MTVTALHIAVGASLLVLTAGVAWSDGAPARTAQLAALGSTCAVPLAQPASTTLYGASTTARHTNVIRVRYAAAHAMPPKRPVTAVAAAGCTTRSDGTALD